jgi:hypothetical protein
MMISSSVRYGTFYFAETKSQDQNQSSDEHSYLFLSEIKEQPFTAWRTVW